MRRWLGACAITVLLAALVAPSAGAAAKDAHGWWWRAETGLLGAAVPPPGVPEDGLVVETTPDGPSAVSALRYRLADGESRPVLVLTVADQHGEPSITACIATAAWKATHGGPWAERPTYDCGSGVDGAPSEDGQQWRWEVDALVRKGRLDVVLVPAPGVGRVTFTAPDGASLQTQGDQAGGGQSFAPPPVAAFDDDGSSSGTGSSGGSSSARTAPGLGNVEAPALSGGGPGDDAWGSQETAQGPLVAPPGTADAPPPQAADPLTSGPAPTAGGASRTVGAIVAAMAAVLMLALWHQDSSAARGARSLGRAGIGAAGATVGGLGRFARPRTSAHRPLR